jgi:hypothetical protein
VALLELLDRDLTLVANDLGNVVLEAIEGCHGGMSGWFSANAALHLYMCKETSMNNMMPSFDFSVEGI